MKPPLDFRDGVFRVSVCENGHILLEVYEDDVLKFVSVMDTVEASQLSLDLVEAIAKVRGLP